MERTDSPHWDETIITWATAPEGNGDEIGRLGTIESGLEYGIVVTSAIHPGHEGLSLRLYPLSTEECLYVSNGGSPKLDIVFGDV